MKLFKLVFISLACVGLLTTAACSTTRNLIVETMPCTTCVAPEPAPEPVEDYVMPEVVVEGITIDLMVNFDYDSSVIREDQLSKLNQLLSDMGNHPEIEIAMGGFASTEGASDYNQALSQRRVDSVEMWLIANGISAVRIKAADGMGETTDFGLDILAPNRCVQIISAE